MLIALTTELLPCARVCFYVPPTTNDEVLIANKATSSNLVPKPHLITYFLKTILSTNSLRFGSLKANTEMKSGVYYIY